MIKRLILKIKSDTHLQELLKGSVVAFMLRIFGMFLGYIFSLMLAHKYGAEGMGVFSLTVTYVSIATVFAKAGLGVSVMKFIAQFHGNNDVPSIKGIYWKGLKLVLFFSIVASIIFFLLSKISASYIFKKESLTNAFYFGVIAVLPIAIIHFHAEAIRGYKKIAHYFILNGVSVPAINIILMNFNFPRIMSDYVYIDIYIVSQLCTAILAIILWLKDSCVLQVKILNTVSRRRLFKTSFPIMISSSILLFMGWIDIIMIGVFKTEVDVGIYSVALKLSTLTSLALIAVTSVVAPKISRMYYDNNMINLEKIIHQSTKIIFVISLPISIIFFLYPSSIMVFFGEQFKVGANALVILSIGQLFNAASGPVGQILNMTDRQNILRNTAIIALLVNVVLNYLLIPVHGITGAAIATAISGIIRNLLSVIFIYIKMNILVVYLPFIQRKKQA